MELKDFLDLMMKYPRIKSISVDQGAHGITSLELYPAPPQVQTHPLPVLDDMPPDDVMMFAATPTFDAMIEEANKKE